MQPLRRNLLPYLALGVGILALGFSAVFVRWADAPGSVMGLYRLGMATLILTPFFLRRRRRTSVRLPRAALIFPLLAGVMTAWDHTIWNTSILFTSAANATLLNNAAPVWVALIAWLFFHEHLSKAFWVGLVLAMSGAAAVLGNDFLLHPRLGLGDLLALVSSLFYAGYFLLTQLGRRHLDTLSYIWVVGVCATLTLLTISLVFGQPLTGYPPKTYLAFLGAAVISQIGGYVSVGYAQGHLPAAVVSPTMIGQPVMTALLAFPLLGEGLLLPQILGGMAVLTGVFLIHRSQRMPASPAKLPLPVDPL